MVCSDRLVGRAELSVHLPPLPNALALAPTAEKLEAAVRATKEAATTAPTSRFVPVTLPAAKAS